MPNPKRMSLRDRIRNLSTKERPQTTTEHKAPAYGSVFFVALLVVYVLYLLLGAVIFEALEFQVVRTHQVVDNPQWAKIKATLNSSATEEENHNYRSWLELTCPRTDGALLDRIFSEDPSGYIELLENDCADLRIESALEELMYTWSFISALYYSMTITTTIGYGHISPTRPVGKVVTMLYAVVGIPLTGILLAKTSDFFGEKIFNIYRSKLSGDKQRSQVFIVFATIIYLALGFVVFIFLPAAAFSYMENWSYLDGIYFSFITLTTIGFGDLVTGRGMEETPSFIAYQLAVIVWIITSLGYWVMVANFISRALKSKKLHHSLLNRAKVLREMMNNDPVFVPQRSKNSLNFMLQLSSMLPVAQESVEDQLELHEAIDAAEESKLPRRHSSSINSDTLMNGALGIPGVAALFNLQNGLSAASLNKKIGESLINLFRSGEDSSNMDYKDTSLQHCPSISSSVDDSIYVSLDSASTSCPTDSSSSMFAGPSRGVSPTPMP